VQLQQVAMNLILNGIDAMKGIDGKLELIIKPQGTGMGLRICRSIIESHGGRVWGVGTPGHGATFHVTLPIARNVPQSPPKRAMSG
jgi:signal transduction histidine kinase